MKNLSRLVLVSLVVLLLGGCNLFDVTSLSPPAWIQGTWADEFDINTYKFETANVIFTMTSISIDFVEAYESTNLSETATTSSYEISAVETGVTAKYTFSKLTATTLNYTVATNGISVGPIVLYKK